MTGLIGNPGTLGDGAARSIFRLGREGQLVVSDGAPRYHEYTSRGAGFAATNAATSQAFSTLLTTTYLGLCVQCPAGAAKSLSIISFGVVSDGTVSGAVGGFAIGGGGSSAGITTHTTPLAALWGTTLVGPAPVGTASAGSAPGSVSLVDSACTLVGSPRVITEVTGGAFTTAPTSGAPCVVDVAGQIVVAPGGYVMSVALIASMTHFVASFGWLEMSS